MNCRAIRAISAPRASALAPLSVIFAAIRSVPCCPTHRAPPARTQGQDRSVRLGRPLAPMLAFRAQCPRENGADVRRTARFQIHVRAVRRNAAHPAPLRVYRASFPRPRGGRRALLRPPRGGPHDADPARPPLRLFRSRRSGNGWSFTTPDPEGKLQRDAWLELADRQLAELAARRVELDEIIAELKALREATAAAGR